MIKAITTKCNREISSCSFSSPSKSGLSVIFFYSQTEKKLLADLKLVYKVFRGRNR